MELLGQRWNSAILLALARGATRFREVIGSVEGLSDRMLAQRLLSAEPDAARAVVLAQTSASFGSKDPAWAEEFIRARLGPLDAGQGMAALAAGMVAELAGDDPDPDGMALARECFARTPDSTYRDMVLALPGYRPQARGVVTYADAFSAVT